MRLPRHISGENGLSVSWLNSLVDAIRSLAPIGTPSVRHDWTVNGVRSYAGAGSGGLGIDLDSFAFGAKSHDTAKLQITFFGGPVLGGGDPVIATEQAVNIGGTENNPNWVVVKGTVNPLTAAIYESSVSTLPAAADNQWCVPLCQCYAKDGAMFVPKGGVCHVGFIDLKSYYE